jgi:hypothetical protein
MNGAPVTRGRPVKPLGLCANCRHARRIETRRGSRFLLCGRAADDPQYVRYPPLPVMRCPGHEPVEPEPEAAGS